MLRGDHKGGMVVVLGGVAPFVGLCPSHFLFLCLLCQIPFLLLSNLLFPLYTSGCSNKAHGGATKRVCAVVESDDEGECGVVEGIDCALSLTLFPFEEGRGSAASLIVLLQGHENTRMILPAHIVQISENQNKVAF